MLQKIRKNKKGFTLIELIVVVAIIAILAAIAVPNFLSLQTQAQNGVEIANATALVGAVNVHNAANPDSQITTTAGITSTGLGSLWPVGIDGEAAAAAIGRISFTGSVAIVSDVSTSD